MKAIRSVAIGIVPTYPNPKEVAMGAAPEPARYAEREALRDTRRQARPADHVHVAVRYRGRYFDYCGPRVMVGRFAARARAAGLPVLVDVLYHATCTPLPEERHWALAGPAPRRGAARRPLPWAYGHGHRVSGELRK
jgi:hypothetical protein